MQEEIWQLFSVVDDNTSISHNYEDILNIELEEEETKIDVHVTEEKK